MNIIDVYKNIKKYKVKEQVSKKFKEAKEAKTIKIKK
jgi:hypothetical protein